MHCKEALHYNEEEEEEAEKEEGGGAEGGIALQDGTWPGCPRRVLLGIVLLYAVLFV